MYLEVLVDIVYVKNCLSGGLMSDELMNTKAILVSMKNRFTPWLKPDEFLVRE